MSRPSGVACCILICSAFVLSAADPPWFSQPQFFNIGDAYWNPSATLLQVPFTGQEWGIGFPNNVTNDAAKAEIAHWRRPYFAVLTTSTVFRANLLGLSPTGVPPPEWDSFRMRTLDGAYLNFSNPAGSGGFGGGAVQYSLFSSVYQAAMIAWAQHAVDIGADGVMIDGISTPLASMLYLPPHDAGSFDSATMAAFRGYLQQNYNGAVLQSQFGINDVSTFDFGDYIRSKGLSDTWNHAPLTGLPLEFFHFTRQAALNFFRNLVTSTKQYAQQTYHRDFLFSCNATFDPMNEWVRDVMDMTTNESSYIRGQGPGDHPFMAPNIRAWKGWKAPVLLAPEAYSPALNVPNPLTKATVNLESVIIADIQASGGMPSMQAEMNAGVGFPESVDLSVVTRYVNFILNNPQLTGQAAIPSKVALLESSASLVNTVFASAPPRNAGVSQSAYMGLARILLDSGLSYDSVFLPDSSDSTLSSPSATDLARYAVVAAPMIWTLDDTQLNSLPAYAQQGGTLVIVGALGTNLPNGQPANRPQLQTILSTPGQTSYGAGTIVVSTENYGLEYEQTRASFLLWQNVDKSLQRKARAAFQALVAPFVQPDVQVSGVTAVVHEPGVTPFFYRDSAGRALVHLVNYDYNEITDQFDTKTQVGLSVRVGAQPVDEVILRSPDMSGAQSLPFTRNGDIITLTVPQVDAWDVLLFQQNQQAPVITSASPAPALAAIGGNSFSFSVQATDADGNPLSYTWTVNGQVVTGVFGSAYTLQLPATASGIYTVAAAVTDGSRVTQTRWTINVAARHSPRVLFDESHGETDTIDSATASRLNSQHPDWAWFGQLTRAMQANYQVSRLTAGPITAQSLNGVDVLAIAHPQNALTAAEIQAISAFVQGGGSLMFLGGAYGDLSVNNLIGAWGLKYDGTRIETSNPLGCGSSACFNVTSFANHPAVGTASTFYVNNSGSVAVSSGGTALAQTTAAEWKSTSGQATQQPGDPNGPFAMMAAAQPGKGRVVISGSDAFVDVVVACGCNDNISLFLSALDWLTAAVNPLPTLPASRSAISAVVNSASFGAAISPGSWATVTGQNLANTPASGQVWTSSDFNGNLLPTALNGTSVLINGRLAAVEFISPALVNVQVPDDLYQGAVSVQVISPFGLASGTANLQPAAPAIFPVTVGNTSYAAAVGLDSLLIAPPDRIPGARAAHPGEILLVFGTGFGEAGPHQPAGQLINGAALVNTVTATICGQQADVGYGGLISPGLDQINLTVPALPPGNCALQLSVAGMRTQSGIVIPIGQ